MESRKIRGRISANRGVADFRQIVAVSFGMLLALIAAASASSEPPRTTIPAAYNLASPYDALPPVGTLGGKGKRTSRIASSSLPSAFSLNLLGDLLVGHCWFRTAGADPAFDCAWRKAAYAYAVKIKAGALDSLPEIHDSLQLSQCGECVCER